MFLVEIESLSLLPFPPPAPPSHSFQALPYASTFQLDSLFFFIIVSASWTLFLTQTADLFFDNSILVYKAIWPHSSPHLSYSTPFSEHLSFSFSCVFVLWLFELNQGCSHGHGRGAIHLSMAILITVYTSEDNGLLSPSRSTAKRSPRRNLTHEPFSYPWLNDDRALFYIGPLPVTEASANS